MKHSSFIINNQQIWLTIQPLYSFRKGIKLILDNEFICYFSYSAPVYMMEGELLRDDNKKPKIFLSEQEIPLFALKYIKQKMS